MQSEGFVLPVDAKPLFRPDVLRSHLDGFTLPERIEPLRGQLADWADMLATGRANRFKEQELLPDFLSLFFQGVLGYLGPADNSQRYTITREHHVEVDGKFADAVLGEFNGTSRYVVAVEGKGPKDPLDRPFGGRRMSAVDQGYRYAWGMNPSGRNLLYNKEGIPASPFRTDDWPLFDPDAEIVTVEKPAKPEVKNSVDWERPEMTQGG